jgi:hypothetical protein
MEELQGIIIDGNLVYSSGLQGPVPPDDITDSDGIPLVRGCTDVNAINYNPNAGIEDGSCQYDISDISGFNPSSTIIVGFKSQPFAAAVYVNGVDSGVTTPDQISFNYKELLSWKYFEVKKAGFSKSTKYRAKSVLLKDSTTSVTVGKIIYNIEKLDERGVWVGFLDIIADGPTTYVTLGFQFEETIQSDGDTGTDPTVQVNRYFVEIEGDVSAENIISYRTSDDEFSYVRNGVQTIEVRTQNSDEIPWIEFQREGITNSTHTVIYTYVEPNQTNNKRLTTDFRKELTNGTLKVLVVANKIVDVSNNTATPRISIDVTSLEYNINSGNIVQIPYSTVNTDRIVYTLGNLSRELPAQGTIRLEPSVFSRGIGNYILYVQPIHSRYGSGEFREVRINVVSKTYRNGPDITHINYPYNIKGSDFKGYDENFKISWQSVNTNYVQIWAGRQSSQTALGRFGASSALTLNVQDVLTKAGINFNDSTDALTFNLLFVPYNSEGDQVIEGKLETIKVVFDKSDLKLRRAQVLYDLNEAFKRVCDKSILEKYSGKYLTHYAHFGDADNKLITTWATDTETFSEYYIDESTNEIVYTKRENALVLKLYEPLPTSVQPNQQLWVSKIQSLTLFEQITLTDNNVEDCIVLSPNLSLDLGDDIGYQILDDLVASGSQTSTQLIEEYINTNEFSTAKLNIQYITGSDYAWDNFVKYSSAEERVENFFYKVQAIEFYETKLNALPTASIPSVNNERTRISSSIDNLKKGFDAFENYIYTEDSAIAYPGAGGSSVSASNDSLSVTWYNTAKTSAETYDRFNQDSFVNNIPSHVSQDNDNGEFLLFMNMIGQHFDVLWSYTNGFQDSKKIMHTNEQGMINDLVYHMLESLGWDADMGVKSQVLWEYAFGQYRDGTQVSTMTGKERQQEIWRRILNNLPYLYKHKGTKRAVHAAMACYGVPSSMLTIMEFGGTADPVDSGTTKFTFDDRTAAVNFDGTAAILVPWNSGSNGYAPQTIEMRINTDIKQDHILVSSSNFEIRVNAGTGSLASFEFVLYGSPDISASTSFMPFFNDEYTNIALTQTVSGSSYVYTLYAKEVIDERVRNEAVDTLVVATGSSTYNNQPLQLTIGEGFIGTMDEFRLWNTPLSESRVLSHTLLPDAIDGNHVSASTEDLILRFDFEYPKDLNLGTAYLPNVAVDNTYYISASVADTTITGFSSIGAYPWNYTPYERTVTANVPSTGVGLSNKIRFETQTVDNYLKFGEISNATNLERTHDSNRLGLFFSPIKEVNMDILKSLGEFNIDNYIGNPADYYNDRYSSLDSLRRYYFDRYTLNIYEYIQLVRYIEKSLFTTLESLVPGRAKVSSGLLIEPHLLERSKIKRTKPTAENIGNEATINVENDVNLSYQRDNHEGVVDADRDVVLTGEDLVHLGTINASDETTLDGTYDTYVGVHDTTEETVLTATVPTYDGTVNAQYSGSLIGEFAGTIFTEVGLDPHSIARAGFGIYAEGGHTIRTYLDVFGNVVRDRKQVFLVKESRVVNVPENINTSDPSLGTVDVPTTFFDYKVTFLPVTGSSPPSGSNIVSATPLEGYLPSHYRYVGDLPTGLQNSWWKGARQTDATTLDGGAAVQTFTTNPNTLRVNDTGRGSGEPILYVD